MEGYPRYIENYSYISEQSHREKLHKLTVTMQQPPTVPSLVSLEQAIDRRPLTVTPETPLADAIAVMGKAKSSCVLAGLKVPLDAVLMSEARGSSVLIMTQKQLVGVFTETDAIQAIASGANLAALEVGAVMKQPAIALTQSDVDPPSIFTALALLRQHHLDHLPILDEQKQLLGIVTPESIRQVLQPADLLKSRQLAEVMTTPVIHVAATASALEIAQLMAKHRVHEVVVTESPAFSLADPDSDQLSELQTQTSENPPGIVTQRDILHLQALNLDLSQIQAQTIACQHLPCFSPSESALVGIWKMQQQQAQQVLVVDNSKERLGEKLLGIVTATSFIQTLDLAEMAAAVEQLQQSIKQFAAQPKHDRHPEVEFQEPESTAELIEQLERNRLLATIALRIRESLDLDHILITAVDEVRQLLQTDRVIIYRFNPDLSGTVVVESTAPGWQPVLGRTITDNCFGKDYAQPYKEGRIQATEDIYAAGLTQCHIDILAVFDIRANLVVPIIQGNHLWGLLCAYHCSGPRRWRQFEIDLLKQLATHIAIAIQQSELYQKAQAELAERERAEEQIKASLREKEILLKEIHHRVKNNLQIISSLLKLQSGYIKDEQALAMFKDSQNRIRSMALIHEKLYQSKDLSRIDFAEYIYDLTNNLLRSYTASSHTIKLTTSADDVWLDIDTAIPCGLIINELVSNSLKHAFPVQNQEHQVNVHIRPYNNKQFILTVSDNGVGFPENVDFRNTETLGLELVCTLIEQLDGTVELDSSQGTKFVITFSDLGTGGRAK